MKLPLSNPPETGLIDIKPVGKDFSTSNDAKVLNLATEYNG